MKVSPDVREWRVSPSNPAVVEAVSADGSVETVARTLGQSREALAAQMVRDHGAATLAAETREGR